MTATRHEIPVPRRLQHLPTTRTGYLVPWFVADVDGEPDFRVVDGDRLHDAVRFGRCFLCGSELGRYMTFAIGPMCAINLVSAEPPSHRECAEYAVQVCPFLTRPQMIRRDSGKPEEAVNPGGVMIERNPGVTLLWTTRSYTTFRARPGDPGVLFSLGDPTSVSWWREGRAATRDEVQESVTSGLPILAKSATQEDIENPRAGARAELERRTLAATRLFPKP
jgi:hypothetical protein